jgi:N-acylglucosamine 2-epimerase
MFRYVDADGGRPRGREFGDDRYEELVRKTWDTKLWWVHVEALYAARLLAERFERADLADWGDRLARYTLDTFPQPGGGEWIQIRDRRGAPLDEVVALPVKDPFHISRALLLMTELDSRRSHL